MSPHEDELVPLVRRGRLEEAYFTFSCSPVRGADGAIEGVMDIATETTRQASLDQRRPSPAGRAGAGRDRAAVADAAGAAARARRRPAHRPCRGTRARIRRRAVHRRAGFERRDEPLDAGLARLAASLERLQELDAEAICDRLLAQLGSRRDDDVALLVARLGAATGAAPPARG